MARRGWELEENQKTKRWFLSISQGIQAESYPSIEDIHARAAERGIDPHRLCSDSFIQRNLDKAQALVGEEFSFPIVIEPTFDVRLNISQDKTRATLYIRKASDKRDFIDLKLVSSAINTSRVKNVDVEKLKDALAKFRASPAMELEEYVLAEGTPPGRGKDRELVAKVEWLDKATTAEICARIPDLRMHGLAAADASSNENGATRIAKIRKDDVLFELSPAETGTPGIDVYGKEILGLPGNDPFFQMGENVTLGPQGLKAERAGILLVTGSEKHLSIRVLPYLDGKATAVVTADNMVASLILESEEGSGKPLTVEMAMAALDQKKIKGDIRQDLIPDAIAQVRATKKSAEIVVLRGTKPILPNYSRVTHFTAIPEIGKTVSVKAHDRILSLQKFPVGSDGRDVFGQTLKASTAKAESAPEHDDSIEEETVDGVTVFSARIGGDLCFHGSSWSVSDTRNSTGDVDDKSGDVDFPGNLTLVGNVQSGRAVKAGGNLSITGNAEASLVSAGESLSMIGGIRGAGRGTAWARQEVSLTFAENARILAGQNANIDKYCFQCMVKTNGLLLLKGNPGALLGGSIRATKGVEVYELGSDKTIRTSISFGQNYLVGDQIEVCEKECAKIRETVEKINVEMKKLSNTDPRIQELRRRKLELLKRNDKLTVRIFTLQEQFETHIISHVRVENTVYPGVILESHGRYYEVRKKQNHVIFTFDQRTGQIVCQPI